ncbi:MAG: hypothetical protein A2Z25_14615 [Planctomycetes bacterium RBG_16_55_9]|nr:MAG: hypothetical protein A2Z25_14615 [Planctomycetes bacterium RBG_16_55_9]
MIISKILASTALAVDWNISVADDAIIESVVLKFSSAPTTSENVTVSVVPLEGAAYTFALNTHDPSLLSETDVIVKPDFQIKKGDTINITYTNTDVSSIIGITYLRIGIGQ